MTRLAITRQPDQLDEITRMAHARGVEIVPLPLMNTEYIKFNINDDVINRLDWLFFTSANGVRSFLDRLEKLNIPLSDKTKIGVVGKKTMEALEEYGLSADFAPAEPYGKNLFLEFVTNIAAGNETVLFARASKIVYDPEYLFNLAGLRYYSIICYETTEGAVPAGNVIGLSESDFILFTAPSAVRSYHKTFGVPLARTIAIGRTTASEMSLHNWQIFKIMDIPDVDMVLDYLY
ncbi:MAG: hypothetical protein CVT49_00620 [candidate division Zixibacteria bacterium HGW-Zixibacteria-1]|nr:MAG: hypothetical protein CVT49_00620 [candidate division Zixibacteria bacterium HGW-Zixibacteria-1]